MSEGWIKLHRSIKEHWIFNDSDKFKAWTLMLMEVNHLRQKVIIRGEVYECDAGQSLYSYDTWAKLFGKAWTKQKVRTFFSLLEKDKMLTHEGLHYTTRITICNYKTYQGTNDKKPSQYNTPDNTPITHGQHADNTPITPNKNDKNENNGKNDKKKHSIEFVAPTLQELQDFCKEKGYTSFDCVAYLKYRIDSDWVKQTGKKVVKWKLDVISQNSYNGFQRKKTFEELEHEAMLEFAQKCGESL
jgi:hypothetical protein